MRLHDRLLSEGFRFSYDAGNDRLVVYPRSGISPSIASEIRSHKQSIVESILQKRNSVKPSQPAINKIRKTESSPNRRVHFSGGVGTELKSIIPKWFGREGCGCRSYAKSLNKKGIDWCFANREEIQNRLLQKASETMVGRVSTTINALVADRWINRAIRNAYFEQARQAGEYISGQELFDFPDDTCVVTAADDRFLPGVYLLAWSLMQNNRCRVICYDLGLNWSKQIKQLQSWGVEFVQAPPQIVDDSVKGWQTWNKPTYISDALRDHLRVIWLDADVSVSGRLDAMLKTGFFIPDHGPFNASANRSPQPLIDIIESRRDWSGVNYPCAGIIGVDQSDTQLIDQWKASTEKLRDESGLGLAKYYDQNVLQNLLDSELKDGNVWNNMSCPRKGSQQKTLEHIATTDATLNHYGGNAKPWFGWPDLYWPTPRGVNL